MLTKVQKIQRIDLGRDKWIFLKEKVFDDSLLYMSIG